MQPSRRLIRSSRRLLTMARLVAGLSAGVLTTGHVHAAFTVCRVDPIVQLSNGLQLNISASIADASTNVQKVTYAVHVPRGVTVNRIVYTGGPFATKEQATVYSDDAAYTYDTLTTVADATSGVQVTAQTVVQRQSGSAGPVTGSVGGLVNQALSTHLIHL